MGTVFEARRADGSFEQAVALKVLHRSPMDEQAHRRFLQERQILAGLRHPNIARLLDGGVIRGMPYLVMERVQGLPLVEYCENQKLGRDERLRLLLQACDAIRHAHREGVVHRDLKPSNLLVEEGPLGASRTVVLDFGIARIDEPGEGVTVTGQIFGTPGYMSPEQASGATVDARSDVYALGIVLYELLAGQRPFEGEAHQILERLVTEEPVPLRRRMPPCLRISKPWYPLAWLDRRRNATVQCASWWRIWSVSWRANPSPRDRWAGWDAACVWLDGIRAWPPLRW